MQSSLNDAVSVTMTIDHHNNDKYDAITTHTCHSVNIQKVIIPQLLIACFTVDASRYKGV